jgi:exonuclease III
MCDIKLNPEAHKQPVHDLEKQFQARGYKFFYNSPNASRGVGILIANNLKVEILSEKKDDKGNMFLLKIQINNLQMVIGSVYGPNDNNLSFFQCLTTGQECLACDNIVLGGDWNATWDSRPAEENIDVINMVNIPSRIRTDQIHRLSEKMQLTDPFRTLYPVKREFTYVPNAWVSINRSRIDFFLISENLVVVLRDLLISPSLTSVSFDHKKIILKLGKKLAIQNFNKKTTLQSGMSK